MASSRRKNRRILVVEDTGEERPFLRGMVTHQLLQRGLEFDRAFAIANEVRRTLSGRERVAASELAVLIEEQLGDSEATSGAEAGPTIEVTYDEERLPFSRGLLAQSLMASGLQPEDAYSTALATLERLRFDSGTGIESTALADLVARLVEDRHGPSLAQRYRLMRSIRRLPKPVVIYIGGTSGTGKSTLAFDLAPLLRIYRLHSTDSIRQVMRMIFSPAILPSLHHSSFEAEPDEKPGVESEEFGGFDEQSRRVGVGVRAVVERSIAENTSVIVEGVHLLPPLVPFPDLDGQAYQIMLMLETRDRGTHRSHFATRTQAGARRAERYLAHFESIRALQDLLLERAEEDDIPTLDTTDREQTRLRALQIITEELRTRVPELGESNEAEHRGPASLLIVLDGLGDQPVRSLAGRTPLQAASTPTFDRLAREGRSGLCDPVAPGVVPDTASGNLALFGHSPRVLQRGPIEAIGGGLEMKEGDIALRANFATLGDNGQIVDRRAGRIREHAQELASELDALSVPELAAAGVSVSVQAGTEHRLALALSGPGLSAEIFGSDPGDAAIPSAPLRPRPRSAEDARAHQTAQLLRAFEDAAHSVLKDHSLNAMRHRRGLPAANCILTRGAGVYYRLTPPDALVGARLAAIAADRTVLGIARASGATLDVKPGMTANLDTDVGLKFRRAAEQLAANDIVVVHIKGADIAAHDRRADLKVQFLETIDRELGRFLEQWSGPLRIAISADHCTLVESGQHSSDPVPAVIWGTGIEADDSTAFDELSAAQGSLQRFPLQNLLARLRYAD
ncbi:MAG: 2,3-bisphosphoglycerate-independent phosphoglycerate mutase [Acidobacteriota bacterium]